MSGSESTTQVPERRQAVLGWLTINGGIASALLLTTGAQEIFGTLSTTQRVELAIPAGVVLILLVLAIARVVVPPRAPGKEAEARIRPLKETLAGLDRQIEELRQRNARSNPPQQSIMRELEGLSRQRTEVEAQIGELRNEAEGRDFEASWRLLKRLIVGAYVVLFLGLIYSFSASPGSAISPGPSPSVSP